MATLAEIRAKLQASSQQTGNSTSGGDNAIYAHWNIPDGATSIVRFLPDKDPSNTFFWIEREIIKLPFAGVKNDPSSKPVVVQVPCVEMYGLTCPILSQARQWFKEAKNEGDKSKEVLGKQYWKKRSYLMQGFIVDNKLQEEKPENPIRRFVMSSQIFNIIKNALMDPEIEVIPTDYVRGLDFKITKTKKGEYADYSTSSWARRERALTAQESEAIDKYGLYNLRDFLPKKPTEVELKVIEEMFVASVDGEAFDSERWSQYYKPQGYRNENNNSKSKDSEVVDEDPPFEPNRPAVRSEPAVDTTPTSNASSRAQDILAAIRNRKTST